MSVRSTTIGVTVTAILLTFVAYLGFLPKRKPLSPAVHIVSNCGELMPGMRRIGDYGFQFDFPISRFKSNDGSGDMPPGPHMFMLRPYNSTSWLEISWHSRLTSDGGVPEIAALTFSGYYETRRIFDDKAHVVGEDSWGYWDGERWRRVYLLGMIAASYGSRNKSELARHGSVHERDAMIFDEIIGSVCKVPDPSP